MSRKKKASSVPLNEAMAECSEILNIIKSRPDALAFLEPVDWAAYGLTDYPEIITNPMDLGTVTSRLDDGYYKDVNAYAHDMRLIWSNCMKYNRPDSDLYMTADKLSKLFEKKFVRAKSLAAPTSTSTTNTKSSTKKESDAVASTPAATKESARADRVRFSQLVNTLTPEQLGHLVEMIQAECPEALNEEDEDELEIEINNIDATTLSSLNAYATQCGGEPSKKKTKY